MEIVTLRGGREEASVIDLRRDPSWLSGPPYAVAEVVFDEYDLMACRPVAEDDVTGCKPEC